MSVSAHGLHSPQTEMKLRSLLFVPGDRPDRVQRAAACGADAVILDLEDAVAIKAKAQARSCVAASLRQGPRPVPYFVRVNALSSGFLDEDLKAMAACPPMASYCRRLKELHRSTNWCDGCRPLVWLARSCRLPPRLRLRYFTWANTRPLPPICSA